MNAVNKNSGGFRLPILQGVLPIKASQIPLELIAGLTLAALAIPEVMGYTKIAGTPVITGLYTILIPMALFALFGSSRHLVVGADSATAAMLAAGLVALITTLMVVFVGVEQGILLAIALSLIDHTRRGYHPKNALLMPTESGEWEPQAVASQAQAAPGLMIYRFTHSMYYANSQQLSEEVTNLVNSAQPPLRWFCLDASAVDDVDYSAAETACAPRHTA